MTDDPDLRLASSLMDYLFRRIALDYLPYEERASIGLFSVSERTQPTLPGVEEAVTETNQGHELPADPPSSQLGLSVDLRSVDETPVASADAPLCMQCGVKMQRAGSCYVCQECGQTSGCS